MNLIYSVKVSTTEFFRLLGSIGIALAYVGTIIIGAQITLSLVVVTAATTNSLCKLSRTSY
ncbi:hypothetical protein J5U18_13255 [Sphingobacteriaceae bacterium WQ 2009]|uniref:Uncharacterized protein n=1 Tax=Rhinopithecimicrobium faecis TaxID=2820698 RepID=A0A8T4HDX1_9SPHI|nr:hypothetical protein [Sphingobacteriaceae bacterium WQ 2009]